MKILKRIVSLSIALASMVTMGGAQERKSKANFSFSCASWENVGSDQLYYLEGKPKKGETEEQSMERLKQVDLSEMTRSLNYAFEGGQKITFYRKTVAGVQPVNTATVPSSWKRVLFVFFPGEKKGSYKLMPLRDDRSHAPYGSYQFVNLSSLEINGGIGKTRISIKPKKNQIVKFTGDKSRSLNFGVWASVEGKKQWLQRNTLTYKPQKYLVYFFYPTVDARGRVKVKSKGIVEFRPSPVEGERLRELAATH
ncbi:hypothetical protein [Rubritalea tangerina]|uniref:Uncharacterized protein n=1 Tax=Rubritalea tangerina TaxID=430798 RepID=A0ABW4ZEG0_9BACT